MDLIITELIKKKEVSINVEALILSIKNDENDKLIVNLQINDTKINGVILIKSDFDKTPKEKNLIQILKLNLKCDEKYILRVFAYGKIINNINNIINSENNKIIDLSQFKILETLKNLIKIKHNLYSRIFIIEKKKNMNYSLKSINDLQIYNLNYNDILEYNFTLIINFYNDKKEIKLTDLSFVIHLNEEELFYVLQNNNISNNIFQFKIIDIDYKGNYLLCDKYKKLYKIERNIINNNNKIEINDKLCKLVLISNFTLIKNDDINIIKLNNNSFIYFSSQNIYFSNKLSLNYLSVIYLNFIDFKNNNYYNKIEILGNEKKIKKSEIYIFVSNIPEKNKDYYPIDINLIHESLNNNKDDSTNIINNEINYNNIIDNNSNNNNVIDNKTNNNNNNISNNNENSISNNNNIIINKNNNNLSKNNNNNNNINENNNISNNNYNINNISNNNINNISNNYNNNNILNNNINNNYNNNNINFNNNNVNNNKSFKFIIYHGLLNRINVFINYTEKNSFFYEFLYYVYNNNFILTNKKIIINKKEISLVIYDNFNSVNRIRFNVLNIPYQKNCPNINLIKNNENSFQICEIFNNNKKSEIFGIFNIKEIENSIMYLEENSYFDDYYDEFANIYNILYLNQINSDDDDQINKFINDCKNIYNNSKINKKKAQTIYLFSEDITFSQFKTRIGFIICYYLNYLVSNCDINDESQYDNYSYLIFFSINIKKISNNNKLTLNEKIRILFFIFRSKIINNKEYKLFFISKLNSHSPYFLANNFNLKEIENLNENSKLFIAYLQLDSYICKNYKFNLKKSFSFSMELLFILKKHLINNYDDFIFINNDVSKEYAFQSIEENITVINEANLFGGLVHKISEINEINESKNYAMPISMEFRHEKNGHMKKSLKNKNEGSPVLYLKEGKIVENIYKKINGKSKGESGRIIESFIDDDQMKIIELKEVKIFGELLDYKLFVKKDFIELKNKINEIKKKNNSNELKNFQLKYENMDFLKEESEDELEERRRKHLEKLGILKFGCIEITKNTKQLLDEYSNKKKKKDLFKKMKNL